MKKDRERERNKKMEMSSASGFVMSFIDLFKSADRDVRRNMREPGRRGVVEGYGWEK